MANIDCEVRCEWKLVAFLVCTFVLASNSWHHLHVTQPGWDDSQYLAASFRLFDSLKNGFKTFFYGFAHASRFKPPLISVLPIPFYLFFGPGERIALWVNDICLLITWISVYQIGRFLYGEREGWAAVIATALMPLIYGLSRVYLVECSLTALVCVSHWALLRSKTQGKWWEVQLGVLLGLGLLIKTIFPLYLLGVVFLYWREIFRRSVFIFPIAFMVASPWYFQNFASSFSYVLSASSGEAAKGYGSSHVFSPPVIFGYLKVLCDEVLSWPYLLGGLIFLFMVWKGRPESLRWRLGFSEVFLLAWFVIPLMACTFSVNKDPRFLEPAMPALAIGIGALVVRGSRTKMGFYLAPFFLLGLLVVFVTQTFGLPLQRAFKYNGPPAQRGLWDRQVVLQAIHQDSAHRPAVVGLNYDGESFNYFNLSSLALLLKFSMRFINLNYGVPLLQIASQIKPEVPFYVVIVKGDVPVDFDPRANVMREPLQKQFENGEVPAQKIAQVPIFVGVQADIYRLVR